VQAIVKGDVSAANLSAAETALLAYVKKVTEAAYKTTPEDVQGLRNVGWKEEQIAEAVYITAMFAFFNRVADAFGIAPMGYLEANKVSG
jgi:alkylhydroperoxidase family enzyme